MNVIVEKLRLTSQNLKNCIITSVACDRAAKLVTVKIITDAAYTAADETAAAEVLKSFVPLYFNLKTEIVKLTPDCEMVKRKVQEGVCRFSKAIFATLGEDDVSVEKTEHGFKFNIFVPSSLGSANLCAQIEKFLEENFCGEFVGECVVSRKNLQDLQVEESKDEIEYEVPARYFPISEFEFIEGEKIRKDAVYIADFNFPAEEAVVCGTIESLNERSYVNKTTGAEKNYLSLTINDGTAQLRVTYFFRQKTAAKIRALKEGDSIVCTGKNEDFKGNLRFTAKTIDFGKLPPDFVPEQRQSKPVPAYYHFAEPQPFCDVEQTDFLTSSEIPDCLKGHEFVVFDLETTGLNCIASSGTMDKIIEIGAVKIRDGEIVESFSTFINPERKLSDEVISLTGITDEMVANAPTYEQAMPDFYKFCFGHTLIGHNLVGFDYKFVDYYWSRLGYFFDRKLIDTLSLAHEFLYLPNYKLNTIADKFGITFNHHRATDDALATAKVFIELIKLKKSLPKTQ